MKAYTAIDGLSIKWNFGQSDQIKWNFLHAVAVSILLYGRNT